MVTTGATTDAGGRLRAIFLAVMDLEALRAFLAVVETGSFVAASTSLRWARATLRRRVDELEVMAGVPLLLRSGQGATPTEAGLVLAKRGREILSETSALLSSVREVGAQPSGLVRLALPVGLPPMLLLPMYATLRARHPALRVSTRLSEDPVAELLTGVDVALCFGAFPPEGPWVTRELLRVSQRLVASRDYLRERGAPRDVAELRDHELLWWPAPGEAGTRLPLKRGGAHPVVPALVSADIHLLRGCAAQGLGIAWAPDGEVAEDVPEGQQLVPVLEDLVGTTRSLRVVMPSALSDIPRIRAVLDVAEELLPAPVAKQLTRRRAR